MRHPYSYLSYISSYKIATMSRRDSDSDIPRLRKAALKRGQKKKEKTDYESDSESGSDPESVIKRGPGRSRKYPVKPAPKPTKKPTKKASKSEKKKPVTKSKKKKPPQSESDSDASESEPDFDSEIDSVSGSDATTDWDSDTDERTARKSHGTEVEGDGDPPGEFSLPVNPPARIFTLTGLPGAGKSHMLKYLMYCYAKLDFFSNIVVFCPTASVTGDYDWLQIPGAVHEKWDETYLISYMNFLKEKRRALRQKTGNLKAMLQPNAIIIDDCIGLMTSQKKKRQAAGNDEEWSFENFVSTLRHTSTYLFILSQYIAAKNNVSTTLRNNTNFALMWKQPMERSVEALYEAYGGMYASKEEFKKNLIATNGRKFSCLMYRNGYDTAEGTYLRICAGEVPDDFVIKR